MKLTLGINNCFAIKRWPAPDEWAQIVGDEFGLSVVQHSLDLSDIDHALESEAESVRHACEEYALTVDSVFTGLVAYSRSLMLAPGAGERQRAVDYWSAMIRFAARVGARRAGGHVGSLSRRDRDDPRRRRRLWSDLQQHLGTLSELAHDKGLDALLVENMACDREPSTMPEIESLLTSGDVNHAAVTLCLDVGHQCAPGARGEEADPYAWLRRLGARSSVVHVQQTDAGGDHHWPFTEKYNRRGRIRPERVLEALGESGATQVSLILEVIPPFEADDRELLGDLQESVRLWQDAMGPSSHDAAAGVDLR